MKELDDAFNRAAANFAILVKEGALDRALFTSAVDGEGVTTVMLHIANRLTNRHAINTLAVELCWRKPSFASLFRLDPERCLAAFAAGDCSADECVQKTPSGLSIVPFTGKPLHFGSSDIAALLLRFLDELSDKYDCVLVDCASMVGQADTLLVSQAVPKAILVVKAGQTRAEVVRRVKRDLDERGVELIGTILNWQRRWIPQWIYRLLVN